MRYGFLLLVGTMEGEEAKKFSIPADCVKPKLFWLWNSSFHSSFLISAASQVMDLWETNVGSWYGQVLTNPQN